MPKVVNRPSRSADAALTEVQQKLASLDRDAAISVMVNKLGMSDAQARQLVQTTIGDRRAVETKGTGSQAAIR